MILVDKNITMLSLHNKWLSMTMVLYPILTYYGYGVLSLAFCSLMMAIALVYAKTGMIKLSVPFSLIMFILYSASMRVICSSGSMSNMLPLNFLFMYIVLGLYGYYLNIVSVVRVYRIVAYLNVLMFVIQEIMFYSIGYRVLGIFTFMPLNVGGADFDILNYSEVAMQATRSSAFFSEPAHLSQFLLPLVIIELFYAKDRNKYWRVVLFVAVLIMSASGNALLGLILALILFIIKKMQSLPPIVSVVFVGVVVTVMSVAATMILNTEYAEKVIDRSAELDSEQTSVSSGFIRIFRGYYVWDELTWSEKLFGLNSSDKLVEKIRQCDVAMTFAKGDTYLNGVQSVLIQFGIFGTILFCSYLLYLWRYNTFAGRGIIILFVLISFIASTFASGFMYLCCAVAFLMKPSKRGVITLCV